MAETLESQVEALYRLDPEDFVAARNELAKQVRGQDRKAASTIRNLAKPTVAAWAINQVSLNSPELVDQAIAATDDLRAAQDAAVGGDRSALRAATDKRRQAIAAVVDAAVGALDRKGRAGETHREAIRNTVEAASLDPSAAEVLRAGRLEHEMDAPATFGSLADISPDEPTSRSERRSRRARQEAGAPTAPEEDPEELQREARRARAEAEDLADLATTARERAQEAAQTLRDAREAVEEAEGRVKEAKRDLDRAMDAAKTTSMRAAEIERRAEEARRRSEQLEAALPS